MKKAILALLVLALALPALGGAEAAFTPGTYTSIAEGRNGPVVLQMDFSEDAILDVRVVTHNETYLTGNVPMELYPAQIVGIDSRVGSLVPGKDADLVVLSGHPFAFQSRVKLVLCNGQTAYRADE